MSVGWLSPSTLEAETKTRHLVVLKTRAQADDAKTGAQAAGLQTDHSSNTI